MNDEFDWGALICALMLIVFVFWVLAAFVLDPTAAS